jgi:hypothetical protein
MAEPARIHALPDLPAPQVTVRSRPALYADYLPEQAMDGPHVGHRWPNLRWAARQLVRGAFVALVVAAACLFLWSRK